MPNNTQWPEGMTDSEAVDRLQAIALGACDGVRDIANDRSYKALRGVLISRSDLSDVVPSFVRSQRDLTLLWTHLKSLGTDRKPRRDFVTEAFIPLLDRVQGRTSAPTRASGWTGRRTVHQQAQIVWAHAPTAFQAVDMLLDEQEKPLSNGGPVEPERLKAIAELKALHDALGQLLSLVQTGRPFGPQLRKVRALRDRAFKWSTETYELTLAQSPLMASSAVLGSAVWFLTNLITKDVEASATFAGAIVGGGTIVAGRHREKTQQTR
jgi:hypothetical protein